MDLTKWMRQMAGLPDDEETQQPSAPSGSTWHDTYDPSPPQQPYDVPWIWAERPRPATGPLGPAMRGEWQSPQEQLPPGRNRPVAGTVDEWVEPAPRAEPPSANGAVAGPWPIQEIGGSNWHEMPARRGVETIQEPAHGDAAGYPTYDRQGRTLGDQQGAPTTFDKGPLKPTPGDTYPTGETPQLASGASAEDSPTWTQPRSQQPAETSSASNGRLPRSDVPTSVTQPSTSPSEPQTASSFPSVPATGASGLPERQPDDADRGPRESGPDDPIRRTLNLLQQPSQSQVEDQARSVSQQQAASAEPTQQFPTRAPGDDGSIRSRMQRTQPYNDRLAEMERERLAEEKKQREAWDRYYATGGERPYPQWSPLNDPGFRDRPVNAYSVPPGGMQGQARSDTADQQIDGLVERGRAEIQHAVDVGETQEVIDQIRQRYSGQIRDVQRGLGIENSQAQISEDRRQQEVLESSNRSRGYSTTDRLVDAGTRAAQLGGAVEAVTDRVPGLQGQRNIVGALGQANENIRDTIIGGALAGPGYEQIGQEGYNADAAIIKAAHDKYGYDESSMPQVILEQVHAAQRRIAQRIHGGQSTVLSAANRNPDSERLRTVADLAIGALTSPLSGPVGEINAIRNASGLGRVARGARYLAGTAIDPSGAVFNAGVEGIAHGVGAGVRAGQAVRNEATGALARAGQRAAARVPGEARVGEVIGQDVPPGRLGAPSEPSVVDATSRPVEQRAINAPEPVRPPAESHDPRWGYDTPFLVYDRDGRVVARVTDENYAADLARQHGGRYNEDPYTPPASVDPLAGDIISVNDARERGYQTRYPERDFGSNGPQTRDPTEPIPFSDLTQHQPEYLSHRLLNTEAGHVVDYLAGPYERFNSVALPKRLAGMTREDAKAWLISAARRDGEDTPEFIADIDRAFQYAENETRGRVHDPTIQGRGYGRRYGVNDIEQSPLNQGITENRQTETTSSPEDVYSLDRETGRVRGPEIRPLDPMRDTARDTAQRSTVGLQNAVPQRPGGRLSNVVPPRVVDTFDIPVNVPTDPRVVRAIEALGGSVGPNGIDVHVTRAQDMAAHGGMATRGGPFYEPVKPGETSSYQGGNAGGGVGGSDVIPTTLTRFRNPIIAESIPGEGHLDSALRQLDVREPGRGGSYGRLVTFDDINRRINEIRLQTATHSPERAQALKDLVSEYGGDPSVVDTMIAVRPDSQESGYAITENIIASAARRKKVDGVLYMEDSGSSMDVYEHPEWVAARDARAKADRNFLDVNQRVAAEISPSMRGDFAAFQDAVNADPRVSFARQVSNRAKAAEDEVFNRLRKELSGLRFSEVFATREGSLPTPGPRNQAGIDRVSDLERQLAPLESRYNEIQQQMQPTLDAQGRPVQSPHAGPDSVLRREWFDLRDKISDLRFELTNARDTHPPYHERGRVDNPEIKKIQDQQTKVNRRIDELYSQTIDENGNHHPMPPHLQDEYDDLMAQYGELEDRLGNLLDGPDRWVYTNKSKALADAERSLAEQERELRRAQAYHDNLLKADESRKGSPFYEDDLYRSEGSLHQWSRSVETARKKLEEARANEPSDLSPGYTVHPDIPIRQPEPVPEPMSGQGPSRTSGSDAGPPGQDSDLPPGMGQAEYEARDPGLLHARSVGATAGGRVAGTGLGAIGGYNADQNEDTPTVTRLVEAGLGALVGGATGGRIARRVANESMAGAGRFIDRMIEQGRFSPEILSTHPLYADRFASMLMAAAAGKPDDYVLSSLPSVTGLAKTHPVGILTAASLPENLTAGQVRELFRDPTLAQRAWNGMSGLMADAVTGIDRASMRAQEIGSDIVGATRRLPEGQAERVTRLHDRLNEPSDLIAPDQYGVTHGAIRVNTGPAYESVERVSRDLGIPTPAVYISPDPTINASAGYPAQGWRPSVVINSAYLSTSRDELDAAVAHEIGHIGQQSQTIERSMQPSLWDRIVNGISNVVGGRAPEGETAASRMQNAVPGGGAPPPGGPIRPTPPTVPGEPIREPRALPGPQRSTDDIIVAAHSAVGVPVRHSALEGTNRLERWRRYMVRNWTDKAVDLSEVQNAAQSILGRPLDGDEMVYEASRVNPTGPAKITIDESIRPVLTNLDSTKPILYVTSSDGKTASLTERQVLSRVMELVNNRDVALALENPGRIFPGGITGEESGRAARALLESLAPEQQTKLGESAQALFSLVDQYRDRMVAEGLWTPQLAADMKDKYPHWTPTRILDFLRDKKQPGSTTIKSISLRDRNLRKYTLEGTEKSREDAIASLVRYVQQSEEDIAKNRTFNSFHNLRERVPGWSDEIKEVSSDTSVDTSKGLDLVTGFVNGERKTYLVPAPMAAAVKMESLPQIPGVAHISRWFRELITRTPVFIAGQVPMDFMSTLVRESAREGGPHHAPRVIAALAGGYSEAFRGLLQDEYRGLTAEYLREGGAMAGYYQRGAQGASHALEDLSHRSMFQIRSPRDLGRLTLWLLKQEPTAAVGQRFELAPRTASYRLGLERERRATIKRGSIIEGTPTPRSLPSTDVEDQVVLDMARPGSTSSGSGQPRALPSPQNSLPAPTPQTPGEVLNAPAPPPPVLSSSPTGPSGIATRPSDLGLNQTPQVDSEPVPVGTRGNLPDDRRAKLRAMTGARDVTLDFQRGGAAAQMMNQIIPFFNIGFQAAVTPVRMHKENGRGSLTTIAAMIGAPLVAVEAWNRADEQRAKDYEDVPDYVKDRAIIIMTGTSWTDAKTGERHPRYVIIPTREFSPFVIASREIAGRTMGALGIGHDVEARSWQETLWALGAAASPIQATSPTDLAMTATPLGASTAAQIGFNRDTFRNRNIATNRSDKEAGVVADALSKRFGGRPSQWEFGLRDMLGNVGRDVLGGADLAAELMGTVPKGQEPRSLESNPIVGALTRRFVGDQTGGVLDRARNNMLSPSVTEAISKAGLRSDEVSAVDSKGENDLPFTRLEQGKAQRLMNQYLDDPKTGIAAMINSRANWDRMSASVKKEVAQEEISIARARAERAVFNSIPATERVRRFKLLNEQKNAS